MNHDKICPLWCKLAECLFCTNRKIDNFPFLVTNSCCDLHSVIIKITEVGEGEEEEKFRYPIDSFSKSNKKVVGGVEIQKNARNKKQEGANLDHKSVVVYSASENSAVTMVPSNYFL